MKRWLWIVALALAFAAAPVARALAQPPPDEARPETTEPGDEPLDWLLPEDAPPPDDPGVPGPRGAGKRPPHELIGALRFWRMVDAVGLDEKEIASAMVKMKALEKSEREFRMRRRESIQRISALLRDPKPDEAKLREEIVSLQAAEDGFRKARERHRAELLGSLTLRQKARYILFEDEFPRHLMELRERAKRGRDGPAGGPAGDRPRERPRRTRPVR